MNLNGGARSGELLHQVPQPGEGFVAPRGSRKKTGEFKKSCLRGYAGGLSAGRENFGDEPGQAATGIRWARWRSRRSIIRWCAGTGHRICNDCMKSCIFQKQDPVDIPQVETRTLKDVLELPWGFEIYSLLTRWNPLNFARPVPREATGIQGAGGGVGAGGLHAGASSDERRAYGGGCRRAEDRAAAGRNFRRHAAWASACRSGRFAT